MPSFLQAFCIANISAWANESCLVSLRLCARAMILSSSTITAPIGTSSILSAFIASLIAAFIYFSSISSLDSDIIKATTHERAPLWLLRSRPDQVPGDSMRGDPPSSIVYRKKQIFAKYPFSAVRSPLHERPLGATIGTLSGADSNPPPSSLARIRSAVLQVPLSRTQHLALSPAAFMPAPPCGPRSTVT